MKRLWIIAGFIIFLAGNAWGGGLFEATFDWTRTEPGPGDWDDPANWTRRPTTLVIRDFPAAQDVAVINSPGAVVNLVAPLTVGQLELLNGTLNLGGHDLTATGIGLDENGTLNMGVNSLTATTLINAGTITLAGTGAQSVTASTITGTGLVHFNADGTHQAGLTGFHNLTISAGTRTSGDNITAAGTVIINAGVALDLDGNNLTLGGNLVNSGSLTGTGNFTLNGTGAQSINTGGGGVTVEALTVTKPGGTATLVGSITVTGTTTVAGGDLNTAMSGGHLGTVHMTTGNGTLTLAGTEAIVSSTLTAGTVVFTGANNTSLAGITGFNNLTIEGGERIAPAPLMTVNGALTIDTGVTLDLADNDLTAVTITNNGTITLAGAPGQTVSPSTVGGTGLVHFDDSGTYFAGITTFPNVRISAGNRIAPAPLMTVNGALTIETGVTLDLAGNDLTSMTITNNGTITLVGATGQTVSTTTPAETIEGPGVVHFNADGPNLAGITNFTNLTISAGNRTTGPINVSGSLAQSGGSLTISTGALTMTGTFPGSNIAASGITGQLNINGTIAASGDINITDDIAITGSLIIEPSGSLSMGSYNLFTTNLTINGTLAAPSSSAVITLNNGIWNRTGTFIHNNGTVVFNNAAINSDNIFFNVICTGQVSFSGSNTFNDLTCNSGSEVRFANGSTQTIAGYFFAAGAYLTRGTNVDPNLEPHWTLAGLTPGRFFTDGNTRITWCRSIIFLNRVHNTTAYREYHDSNIRVFAGGTFTWTGGDGNSIWDNDANWDRGYFPPPEDPTKILIIPEITAPVPNYPRLNDDVTCRTLTIYAYAMIDLAGFTLTVGDADGLTNSGTIRLYGIANQVEVNNALPTGVGGIIHYYGNVTGGNHWSFGSDYENLIIDSTAEMSSGGNIAVSGWAEINSNIAANSLDITGISGINANITTNGPGGQIYRGEVRLGGTGIRIFDAGPYAVSLGPVTGNNMALTVNADTATLHGGTSIGAIAINGNAIFQTNPLSAVTVSVTGTSTISADIITAGSQNYEGAVTLGADVTLNAGGTANLIRFWDTVNSQAGTYFSLQIANAGVRFDGEVGGSQPLYSISVEGDSSINADITTSGAQNYSGTIRLGADVTLGGSAIVLEQTEGNGFSLAIEGNAVFNGIAAGMTDLSVTGTSAINADISAAGNQQHEGTITLDGGARTLTGAIVSLGQITAGNGHSLTIMPPAAMILNATLHGGNNIGTVIINGNAAFQTNPLNAVTVSVTGTSAISADIITAGNQNYEGAVILGSDVTLNAGGLTNLIRFWNTVNSQSGIPFSLQIVNGSARFDGEVGGSQPLYSISVEGGSYINADITTSGAQNYNGAVTLGGGAAGALRTLSGSQITLAAITGTGRSLTINAAGAVALNSGTGIGVLNVSAHDSITVETGAITTTGTISLVSSIGDVIVHHSISTPNNGTGHASGTASVFISARSAIFYAGVVTPGTSGEVCLHLDEMPVFHGGSAARIAGDRWHLHARGRHLVYSDTDPFGLGIPAPFLWLNSADDRIGNNPVVHVSGINNIYIVGVGSPAARNARSPTFTVSGSGFIEFRGYYMSSGSIYLNAGTAGIHLNNADIDILGHPFDTNNANVSLLGDSAITAGGIIFGGTVNGAHNLALAASTAADTIYVTGPVGNIIQLGSIEVHSDNPAAAAVTFTGDITANSYSQTGTGSVAFHGTQNYAGNFDFTGTLLTINNNLTTTNNGTVTINSSLTLANTISASGSFTLTGTGRTVRIGDGAIITTNSTPANAAITFESPLTLTGNVTLNSGAGNGDITLHEGVNNYAAGNFTIENGAGTVTLHYAAAINGSFTQSGSGTVNLHGPVAVNGIFQAGSGTVNAWGNITTTSVGTANATITFNGPLVLRADNLVISSIGGTGDRHISFNSTLDGAGLNLTVSAGMGNITFGGLAGTDDTSRLGYLTLINESPHDGMGTVNVNAAIFAGLVIFNGGPHQKAAQDADGARLGDVRINNGTILTLTGNITQRDGGTLTIGQGISGELVTAAYSWQLGPGGAAGTFAVNAGTLVFNQGSALRTNNFFTADISPSPVPPPFDISFAAAASIYASGNVNIGAYVNLGNGFSSATGDLNIFTLIMEGGTALNPLRINAGTGAGIGSLHIVGSGTNAAIVSDIEIRGDVLITPGTILRAGLNLDDSHRIRVTGYFNPAAREDRGARWFQTADFSTKTGPGGIFEHNRSTVEFGIPTDDPAGGRIFRIAGDTTWYVFACHEPLADILFSNYPHRHSFYAVIDVEPRRADGSLDSALAPDGRLILLSRLTDKGLVPFPDGGEPYIPPSDPNDHFWLFYLHHDARLALNFVFLNYSFSSRRIPLPLGEHAGNFVIAWPYYSITPHRNPNLGNPRNTPLAESWHFSYFNVNWFIANQFFYSFTEDSNRNGRIDRIRAQAAFDLMGSNDRPFSGGALAFELFDVEVDGYTIDRSRGFRGFERVYEVTGNPSDRDSIFIFLQEKPYSDAGAVLTWRITRNDSLLDNVTRSIPIGTPDQYALETFDTVPPRINYAFTLPGHPEIFFQMSEPVSHEITLDPSLSGQLNDSGRLPLVRPEKEFLVMGITPYTLSQLASGDQVFRINNVRDMAAFVPDIRNDPGRDLYRFMLPSPRYPVCWNLSGYIEIRGWFEGPGSPLNTPFTAVPNDHHSTLPDIRDWDFDAPGFRQGNKICGYAHLLGAGVYGSAEHRVTDMLISIPPRRIDEDTYFIWPLWARYEDRLDALDNDVLGWGNHNRPQAGYMGPGGSGFNDANIIWDFTGRRFLELDSIVMQSRLSNNLPGLAARLVFDFDVSDELRADNRHGSPSLWLPDMPPHFVFPPPLLPPPVGSFYGIVPRLSRAANFQNMNQAGAFLFNHTFNETNTPQRNTNVEFFYQLSGTVNGTPVPSNLLAARLDITPGTAIPADWFRRVRPFSFGIHGITRQRSGVTILNNVINSSRRERVFLDFRLLRPGRVTIQVFTLDGTLVRVLEQGHRPASGHRYHRVSWDGTNNAGRPVARGMYFIRIVAPDIDEIRKVMVVR